MRSLLVLSLFILAQVYSHDREPEWWETTVYYQIYPRSFKDSDGDGIGDLNGITEGLEYLKEVGIGATWLSPIFKSPMYDFGYDVSDFYAIQDEYGTMEDFENLIKRANELDIKIILDFVPNHGSNESVWFQEALKGHEKYYDYFIWEDGVIDENGELGPPNNWISVFRKSAWAYSEEVGKYYLHQFLDAQPDLNYRNPVLVEQMKDVLRFWLDKGVAGFRVDAIIYLYEADKELHGGKYPDEPLSGDVKAGPLDYEYLDHIHTRDQNETFDMIYEWREVLDEYKAKDGVSRVMMTEAYTDIEYNMRFFGDGNREGAQVPFNFVLISDLKKDSSAAQVKYALDQFLTFKPVDKLSNWVAGNHDNSRIASRLNPELVDGINMIILLLPGIAVTYYGEEIGMVDGYVSWEDTVDPSGCNVDNPEDYMTTSRDPVRTPFQWNSNKNAGFSSGNKTWLPVADGYEILNVEVQRTTKRSHLNVYKNLVELRGKDAFIFGRYDSVALNNDIFAFKRWHKEEIYIVVINFRDVAHTVDLTYFENVEGHLEIILTNIQSLKEAGSHLEASAVTIDERESLVLKVL